MTNKTKTNKCNLPQRAIDVGARVKKSKDGSWAIWMLAHSLAVR